MPTVVDFYSALWPNFTPPLTFEQRIVIANDVVSVWGGVKNNKPETIKKYITVYSCSEADYPLAGVASYSKILGVINPDLYAIYDARVAVALNAIQYIYGVKKGLIFNYIPGRNKTTGNARDKKGFVYTSPFQKNDLKKLGWETIKRDDTYSVYLSLLKDVLSHFPDRKLYEFEMILFANAEKLALKAIAESTKK